MCIYDCVSKMLLGAMVLCQASVICPLELTI